MLIKKWNVSKQKSAGHEMKAVKKTYSKQLDLHQTITTRLDFEKSLKNRFAQSTAIHFK